jgi:hypothetical protein
LRVLPRFNINLVEHFAGVKTLLAFRASDLATLAKTCTASL